MADIDEKGNDNWFLNPMGKYHFKIKTTVSAKLIVVKKYNKNAILFVP